jgi:outer membrane protein assembly factor BamE (lipoprotein component of BamABCDE complex)
MKLTRVLAGSSALLAFGATLLLVACTPVINQRGYVADATNEATIKPGADTKSTVQERLGYASTTTTFGGDNVWYYISQTEKQIVFFTPTVLNRRILAVTFDKDGKVANMRHYTLKDGHVIALETRETPARGRELTFLQQLLSATTSQDTTPLTDVNPGGGGLP